MSFSHRSFFASILVGIHLGILAFWVTPLGCGAAQLTPEEAKQELDVACAVFVRAMVKNDEEKIAAVASAVCHSEVTAALVTTAMENFEAEHDASDRPAPDFIVESFPDGGTR